MVNVRYMYDVDSIVKCDGRREPVSEPVCTSNDDTINYYAYKKLHSRFNGFTSCYDCK